MADTTTKTPQSEEIPALGIEQGVGDQLAFSTPFNPVSLGLSKSLDEELHEVLRDEFEVDRPSVRQLVTMRRLDGHARALYRLLTLPIRSALQSAVFIPAGGGEAEAEFIDAVFRTPPAIGGMETTFQAFMGQLLTALFDGFSCFEKVFWIPEYGPLSGKTTLQKLAYRPSETVTFVTDKHGSFAGFRQRSSVAGKVVDAYIEPMYAFYYSAQEDERKFYGVSFFESAFPHYDAKAKAYFTAHLAAQRAAVGTRVGTVPPNSSKPAKTEFAKNLSNLSLAQWMTVPDGFKVEVLREGGSFDFLNLINHHNHMMSESILANFFDKDSGGGSGESGALVNFAQPGDDMFILMLRAIMGDIADAINHNIIPQLIDLNFDGSKYPTFTWGTFTDEQRQAIASTFDKLATGGQSINVSKEFMRELEKIQAEEFGIEIDWEAVEQREAEELAQQQALDSGGAVPGQPGADGELATAAEGEVTDEELAGANDLSDVLSIMAKNADAKAQQGAGTQPQQKVQLAGIDDDMIEWATRMVALSGKDWSDG